MSQGTARRYLETVAGLVARLMAPEQSVAIARAGELVADAIADEGLFFAFGPGHQSAVASEVAWRAGGLAPAVAMLDAGMTLLAGYQTGEAFECLPGYGRIVFDKYRPGVSDVLVLISQSGRNPAVVDVALAGRERGCRTIAITSLAHTSAVAPAHASGKRLFELVDVVIDTGVPYGDTALELGGAGVGPLSVGLGMAALNAVVCDAAERLAGRGITPPCWRSSNISGAEDHNAALMRRYATRLRDL